MRQAPGFASAARSDRYEQKERDVSERIGTRRSKRMGPSTCTSVDQLRKTSIQKAGTRPPLYKEISSENCSGNRNPRRDRATPAPDVHRTGRTRSAGRPQLLDHLVGACEQQRWHVRPIAFAA